MTVTSATIAEWAQFTVPTGTELALLDRVVAAVTEHITANYQTDTPFSQSQEQAVILQASRLWRRRNTPEGIAAFADLSALRIDSLDRDVAMLLTPQFGFA